MIVLIAGLALVLFSSNEPYTTIEDLETWGPLDEWGNNWPSRLNPQTEPNNYTFWGRYMDTGWWFEFDVSASGLVKVTVSWMEQQSQSMTPIFSQVGTRFDQVVGIGVSGTYHVEIRNEEATPVNVWGNAVARQEVLGSRTVYPYWTLGTLVALVGLASLVFGIIFKPKKRVSKSRARR